MMNKLALLPALGVLNSAFGGHQPTVTADCHTHFAPGQELANGLGAVLGDAHPELSGALGQYLAMMPPSIRETLRHIIHYALTSEPRVLLNFAWAPAYDFEITIWEIPEPPPVNSGITVLLKSRYPDEADRFGSGA